MTPKFTVKKIASPLVLVCLLIFGMAAMGGVLILEVVRMFVFIYIDGWQAEFFPDETRIVFSVPFRNWEQKGIYIFDREKREAVRLTQPDYRDGYPTVFPDGQTIVFSRADKFTVSLMVMGVDGSNQRALTSPPILYADYGAFISPNGKYIAFFRKPFGNQADLMLLELETSKIVCLRQKVIRSKEGCFRWKNDEEIYFLSDSSHLPLGRTLFVDNVKIVNVQTGMVLEMALPDKERIESIGAYEDISFSTNQELLVLCPNMPYLYQLCVRKLFSEEEPRVLTNEQFNVSGARFDRTGKSILFGADKIVNGSVCSNTVYFLDIDTENIEKLYTVSPVSVEVH